MLSSPAWVERRLWLSRFDPRRAEPAQLLRACLTLLATFSIGATAAELAMLRHWGSRTQLVPWVCLGLLALATLGFAVRPSAQVIRSVRITCGVVALGAAIGVYFHVRENYHAGGLDAAYADKWESMSMLSRLWAAFTKSVGPSPALAPTVLLMAALCLTFATLRHPSLSGADGEPNS
jgi:hypothetical protein